MKRIELNVTGMTCDHCVSTVKGALEGIEGVTDVGVSLEKAMAWLNASSGVSPDELVGAVENAGYHATVPTGAEAPLSASKHAKELVIIGGGAAAFAAANRANQLRKKTLLINDKNILPLGGTCVNVGCVPSKIMLHQGAEYYYPARSRFRAISMQGNADFVEALRETRDMVKGFQTKNYLNVIEKQQYVDYKEGHATFKDSHTVMVGDEEFESENILIATGASTFIPPVKGIEDVEYLTNRTVFNLEKKPESIIIFGGGPEAMEFSQIFHHFGIKVTVLQRSDRVLTKFDEMVARELQKYLREEGITIFTGTSVKEAKRADEGVMLLVDIKGKGEQKINAENLLIAAGLKANTDKLEIANSGVELDEKGFIKVNNQLQTSQRHIYAAGDVTGLMPLETVAAKQGNIATLNMLENSGKTINYLEIPQAVFTSPEVASVGMTEGEYMEKYNVCLCRTISFEHVEKAAAIKDTRGLIRMVVDPETKQVIGVQIVGSMAADIITTATYAIKNKMTIYDIRDTVHVFPTLSEVIKKVAQSFDQNLDDMACCVE
ncbi:mercuric reductase [bacterium BMS3Bbin06]|nr:mercuric reductase [bacterium BMS3Bbin06]HDY71465.1 mercury(II) reductase [Nitrospirota bacterium]